MTTRPSFMAGVRRKPIQISSPSPAHDNELSFPPVLAIDAALPNLAACVQDRRAWIETQLLESGAALLRGFPVEGIQHFEAFAQALSGSLMKYTERSTPRKTVGDAVYTSTEYPAHLDIPQHNENSYAGTWPRTIFFFCHTPAATGGETPLADSRKVLDRISRATRDLFAAKGVLYQRNYGLGVDLTWQDAFQTELPSVAEAYCRTAGIKWTWLDDGRRLRTSHVRPALWRHPATNEMLWFNQAHLFHTSSLDMETQEALEAAYAQEDLPRQAFLGDGSPLAPDALEEIRQAYRDSLCTFPWRQGDVLVLDNMLMTHGRKAFTGNRNVYVAMAGPWSWNQQPDAALEVV